MLNRFSLSAMFFPHFHTTFQHFGRPCAYALFDLITVRHIFMYWTYAMKASLSIPEKYIYIYQFNGKRSLSLPRTQCAHADTRKSNRNKENNQAKSIYIWIGFVGAPYWIVQFHAIDIIVVIISHTGHVCWHERKADQLSVGRCLWVVGMRHKNLFLITSF